MKRDQKIKFTSDDVKNYKLTLAFPAFTFLIYWVFLFIIKMTLNIYSWKKDVPKIIFLLFVYKSLIIYKFNMRNKSTIIPLRIIIMNLNLLFAFF